VEFSNDILSFPEGRWEYPQSSRPENLPFSLELFFAFHYDLALDRTSVVRPTQGPDILASLKMEEEEQ
jgi:hypothetical protein